MLWKYIILLRMKRGFNLLCSILVIAALLVFTQAHEDGKCYALALQGGGDKAAYQAGALAQIFEQVGDQAQYDVVTGVGIGAINGAIIASHAKGDEATAGQEILNFWNNLKQKEVYKDWSWGGPVRGLLFKSALYNSSPFRGLLSKTVKTPVRPFYVLATKARDGMPVVWDETTDLETLIKVIDASAAYPGFFDPVEDIDDEVYYDGGTSFSINIADALNRCKALGFAESDIVIDTIFNTGATIKEKDTSDYTSIPMLIRYLEIRLFYNTMDLLERAKDGFREVDFRYTIAPTSKLEGSLLPFAFDSKKIQKNIERGRADAKMAIEKGDHVMTDYLVEYTDLKNAHQFEGDYHDFLEGKQVFN